MRDQSQVWVFRFPGVWLDEVSFMLSGVGGATRNKWSATVQWSLWPAAGCVRSLRTQQRAQCQMPKTSVVGLLSRGYRSRDSFGITIEVVVNDHANNKASQ